MATPLVRAVADVLAAYFAAHPRAADTAEGIHQWWIPSLGAGHSLAVTTQALEQLEADGQVERSVHHRCTVWRRKATD